MQVGSSILHNAFAFLVAFLVVFLAVVVWHSLAAVGHVVDIRPPAAFAGGAVVRILCFAELTARFRRALVIKDHHRAAKQAWL